MFCKVDALSKGRLQNTQKMVPSPEKNIQRQRERVKKERGL